MPGLKYHLIRGSRKSQKHLVLQDEATLKGSGPGILGRVGGDQNPSYRRQLLLHHHLGRLPGLVSHTGDHYSLFVVGKILKNIFRKTKMVSSVPHRGRGQGSEKIVQHLHINDS